MYQNISCFESQGYPIPIFDDLKRLGNLGAQIKCGFICIHQIKQFTCY